MPIIFGASRSDDFSELEVRVNPSLLSEILAPISRSNVRNWSPGCVVFSGQSAIVIDPPQTIAIDKNGAALDKSGSIIKSFPCNAPGSTRHVFLAAST